MRVSSNSGAVRTKVIIAQLVIFGGLIAWFKIYLPHLEKERKATEALERDRRIESFFRWAVVEDRSQTVDLPEEIGGDKRVHPQKLRKYPSLQETEQALGAPGGRTIDVGGGLHVTWSGNSHSLEASFDKGRLYCLKFEDRRTGHGSSVFESSSSWHPF